MAERDESRTLKVAYVMQTRHKRLAFDYLEIDSIWSKKEVMEALRIVYLEQVHSATTTLFQRILLCQTMVVELRSMSEITFDDGEAQSLPARVFLTPDAAEESLTEAFNHRDTCSKTPFCNIYPHLAITAGVRPSNHVTKALFLRRSFDKNRAVVLQLIVTMIFIMIGVAVGIAEHDVKQGAAIAGALLALTASLQASLFWISH